MCPEPNLLVHAAAGTLSGDAEPKIREHLAQCEKCRKSVDELRAWSHETQPVRTHSPHPNPLPEGEGSQEPTLPDAAPAQIGKTKLYRSSGTALPRGTTLGRYMVVDLIGTGGMGVVYTAYDPELDRKVALKLLRSDFSSEEARLRLLREAQAIARLSHPNVIAVHDVGTVEGRVFVAMERVAGGTLREWLETGARGWKETLRVFVEAGRGLAAAHAAGLTHRDFKPDNVLAGEDGRVRVTDFGLARASGTSSRTPGSTLETTPGLTIETPKALDTPLTDGATLIGTPVYMAPEQLAGAPASPESDQFSFCVSLYEGLYGHRPFFGESISELRKQMQSPPLLPPKGTQVPSWVHRILIRGLSPQPSDRYPSMDALLAALQDDPDQRRRRVLAWAGALTALSVSAGAVLYARHLTPSCKDAATGLAGTWDDARKPAIRQAFLASGKTFARDAWDRTERALDRYANAWVESRTRACLAAAKGAELPDVTALRALCLDQRLAELKATTQQLALTDSETIAQVGEACDHLSPVADCDDLNSLASRFKTPADARARRAVEHVRTQLVEAEVTSRTAKYKQGLELAKAAAAEAAAVGYRPVLAEALFRKGYLEYQTGNLKASEQTLREAYKLALEEGHDRVAAMTSNFLTFMVGRQRGRYEEAHQWEEQAAAHIARVGGDKLLTAELLANRGAILTHEAKYDEAMKALEEALSIRSQVLGPEHVLVSNTLNRIAFVQYELGKYAEAIATAQRALEIKKRAVGPKHPDVGLVLGNLGLTFSNQERFREALPYFKEALSVLREAVGPEHMKLAYPLLNLGIAETRQGLYDSAGEHLRQSLTVFEKHVGPDNPQTALALDALGALDTQVADLDSAMSYSRRSLSILEKANGAEHPSLGAPLENLSVIFRQQGKYSEALKAITRSLELRVKKLGADHTYTGFSHYEYGRLLLAMRKPREAIVQFQRALEISDKVVPKDAIQVGERLAGLGQAYLNLGKPTIARPLLERAYEIGSSGYVGARDLAQRQFALAQALWETGTDSRRSLSLATQARGGFAKLDKKGERERRQVEAWLALRQ